MHLLCGKINQRGTTSFNITSHPSSTLQNGMPSTNSSLPSSGHFPKGRVRPAVSTLSKVLVSWGVHSTTPVGTSTTEANRLIVGGTGLPSTLDTSFTNWTRLTRKLLPQATSSSKSAFIVANDIADLAWLLAATARGAEEVEGADAGGLVAAASAALCAAKYAADASGPTVTGAGVAVATAGRGADTPIGAAGEASLHPQRSYILPSDFWTLPKCFGAEPSRHLVPGANVPRWSCAIA